MGLCTVTIKMPENPSAFFDASNSALTQWFNAVDLQRSGRISVPELQTALSKGGLNYSMRMVASLMRVHDGDGSQTLEFQEFCELHKDLQRMQQIFSENDVAQTGKLALPQVITALGRLDFTLDLQPDGAFYKLIKSYDFSPDHLISLDIFIAMCVQLRNAQKMFNLFDSARRGHITLDWNQYVWSLAQI